MYNNRTYVRIYKISVAIFERYVWDYVCYAFLYNVTYQNNYIEKPLISVIFISNLVIQNHRHCATECLILYRILYQYKYGLCGVYLTQNQLQMV